MTQQCRGDGRVPQKPSASRMSFRLPGSYVVVILRMRLNPARQTDTVFKLEDFKICSDNA